jgi:4-hydroxybenzoate polyprenyltransferase
MGGMPGAVAERHPLQRLIRFEAYGILFILAGVFGALLASGSPDPTMGILLVFIAASSAFGFVINDISDIALDAQAHKPRNPLADGSLSCRTAKIVSAILLAVSLACMALLPTHLLVLELATLFVFITYSFWIEVKNIAGLDLVYHALFPALYGWLGYVLFHPLDLPGIVYVILLGIFGAVGELGNEIRDLEKDRHVRKNTVVVIGERPAFFLTIGLLGAAFVLIALFSLLEPGFLWLLPFVPFGAFLMHPVIRAMQEPDYLNRFVDTINSRAIILAAAMLVVFGFLRLTGRL